MDPNEEHLPHIDWDEQPGTWTEDGEYIPDAEPVILPHSLDLPGEVHHA